jgi:uncharacterized protein
MKSYIVFKTKEGYDYLYSFYKNQLLHVHPILALIINQRAENINVNNRFSTLESTFSKQEVDYYYNKYLFLEEKGFFKDHKRPDLSGTISAGNIEYQLANLRQLTLEVTDKCNLKCEYCAYGKFYEDYNERSIGFLDFEKVKTLIDYLLHLWNSELNKSQNKPIYISFYGGEPLLNMKLINKIVTYIQQIPIKSNFFKFSMTTNGVLIDNHIDYLVDQNFSLLISLDGNSFNNSYRVTKTKTNSFERVLSNVNYIKKRYPQYFIENVNFNAVLHNRNSVEEIYNFFKSQFNKIPAIGELSNSGINKSMIEEFNKTYKNINESLQQSEHYDELSKKIFINLPHTQSIGLFINNYTEYLFKNFSDFFISPRTYKRTPTGTCLPFGKKLFLTVNGSILPCERIGQNFTLGKVSEKKIDVDLEKIATFYNNLFAKIKTLCNTCYNSQGCIQCIFNLPNSGESNSMQCYGYTSFNEFKEYLSSHASYIEKYPFTYQRILKSVTID